MQKTSKVYFIDSSAIFSGKPLIFNDGIMVTTTLIADEFSPGGKDYRHFQFLRDKGLELYSPSPWSITYTTEIIKKAGEEKRLSSADISLLALAVQWSKDTDITPIIVTDDYSIQNIASSLEIPFQPIHQHGIKKRYKWERRCQGCKKRITKDVDVCPICGSSIKHVIKKTSPIKKDSTRDEP